MKLKDIKKKLRGTINTISSKGGVFTVKKSYFWGATKCGSTLADKVKSIIPEAAIEDYGNHFHHFVGGAKPGSKQDSYLWVKFKVS